MSASAPRALPVLMYHHVTPEGGKLAVSSAHFESQLRWLAARGYQSLGAEGVARFLAGGEAPPRAVAITFDDGYLDNWVHAAPLLARYGMLGLLFLVSGWPGDGPVRPQAGQGLALPATPGHNDCKTALADPATRDTVIARWSELQAMQASGVFEIHSHTHTHTRWDQVCADAESKSARLAEDLAQSRATLQAQLGVASEHLCWPQGYHDADYRAVAADAGFRHLYTTDSRGFNLPGGAPDHIYRIAVRNRGARSFALRLFLARDPVWGGRYLRWKR